eukprot:scaffold4107_cov95-Isochrysis_galbana.AAC.9
MGDDDARPAHVLLVQRLVEPSRQQSADFAVQCGHTRSVQRRIQPTRNHLRAAQRDRRRRRAGGDRASAAELVGGASAGGGTGLIGASWRRRDATIIGSDANTRARGGAAFGKCRRARLRHLIATIAQRGGDGNGCSALGGGKWASGTGALAPRPTATSGDEYPEASLHSSPGTSLEAPAGISPGASARASPHRRLSTRAQEDSSVAPSCLSDVTAGPSTEAHESDAPAAAPNGRSGAVRGEDSPALHSAHSALAAAHTHPNRAGACRHGHRVSLGKSRAHPASLTPCARHAHPARLFHSLGRISSHRPARAVGFGFLAPLPVLQEEGHVGFHPHRQPHDEEDDGGRGRFRRAGIHVESSGQHAAHVRQQQPARVGCIASRPGDRAGWGSSPALAWPVGAATDPARRGKPPATPASAAGRAPAPAGGRRKSRAAAGSGDKERSNTAAAARRRAPTAGAPQSAGPLYRRRSRSGRVGRHARRRAPGSCAAPRSSGRGWRPRWRACRP